ncbi:zincin-like metallopeptidase domain-containing protein, partial [Xylella fastidiosa]|uniref:zincin-like metallopeptidase domain-containing protein n=1 Tax=Xylella fastidiosa TaxID=2371 RepID=UPI003D069954
MADKSQFPSADNYYATLLHELGHWTGHSLRLDRDMLHPFGSEGYAKEELRAEIASMILGDELGIGHDLGQHAAYVGSWIRALKDDPLEIFRAAADAEKIQEYLLAFEQKQVQQATKQQAIAQNPEPLRRQEQDIPLPTITLADPADEALAIVLHSARHFSDGSNDPENSLHQRMLNVFSEKAFVLIKDKFDFRNPLPKDVLPADWNGRVRVEPSIVVNDGYLLAHVYGREPTHWRVFVQYQNGKYEWLETCTTKAAADTLVDRLAVIDVYSKEQEHERVATFVRTHEKQPRHDKDTLAAKTTVADNTVKEQQQQQDVALPSITVSEKIWLDLPYKQKEAAKHAAGNLADGSCAISWDKEEKHWYVRPGADLDKIKQWLPSHEAKPTHLATKKTWLAVTFEQRHALKEISGKLPNGNNAVDWDNAAQCWYANPGADLDKLKPWIATEVMSRQVPA